MDKQELEKLAREEPEEGYIVIDGNLFSNKLILKHSKGLLFIKALEKAEILEGKYDKDYKFINNIIKQIKAKFISISFMSAKEYQDTKMATLLGVPSSKLTEQTQDDSFF